MSFISRHMSLIHRAMCLKMFPPSLVWPAPGHAPKGFAQLCIPQLKYDAKYTNLTLINNWVETGTLPGTLVSRKGQLGTWRLKQKLVGGNHLEPFIALFMIGRQRIKECYSIQEESTTLVFPERPQIRRIIVNSCFQLCHVMLLSQHLSFLSWGMVVFCRYVFFT